MTVGLNIHIFQITTNKLTEIQELITQIEIPEVKYSNANTFLANGFLSCAGDRESWEKIGSLLSQSRPVIKKRIGVLVNENINEDVIISDTLGPSSVFYYSGVHTAAGIGLDAGQIALRLKATSLIGLRSFCRLDIYPVYKTGTEHEAAKRSADRNSYEFVFDSAALNVRLGPGQFVLLAPGAAQTVKSDIQTISNIIFYPQELQNTVNLCLIICNVINKPL